MTRSDSSFKRITLAFVLGGDCMEQEQKPLGLPTGQRQDKKSAKEWTEKWETNQSLFSQKPEKKDFQSRKWVLFSPFPRLQWQWMLQKANQVMSLGLKPLSDFPPPQEESKAMIRLLKPFTADLYLTHTRPIPIWSICCPVNMGCCVFTLKLYVLLPLPRAHFLPFSSWLKWDSLFKVFPALCPLSPLCSPSLFQAIETAHLPFCLLQQSATLVKVQNVSPSLEPEKTARNIFE